VTCISKDIIGMIMANKKNEIKEELLHLKIIHYFEELKKNKVYNLGAIHHVENLFYSNSNVDE
jgi:hypothetical protein